MDWYPAIDQLGGSPGQFIELNWGVFQPAKFQNQREVLFQTPTCDACKDMYISIYTKYLFCILQDMRHHFLPG